MSDSSPDITGLTAEASQLLFSNYVLITGTALYLYDYALTLSTEIAEIWNSKFSGAQTLFFMARYSFMVSSALLCAVNLIQQTSETLCRVIGFSTDAFDLITEVGLYGILTLRTYAIYRKNQVILVILGLTGVANIALGVCLEVLDNPEVDSGVFGNTCDISPKSINIWSRLRLAQHITSLIFDILVFTLTFAKTIRHAIEMRRVGLGNGLGYFILRDGALYFLAKLLFGVLETIVFFVPASVAINNWLEVVVSMGDTLTVILINRLVLNLRQVSHIQEGNISTLGAIDTIQEPAFATNPILGNLGAQLRVGPEEGYDDDGIEEMGVDDEAEKDEEREIVSHTEIMEEGCDLSDV